MPNYICFYLGSNKIRGSLISEDELILDSKREIGIREGDKFITFLNNSYNDFQFKEYGLITEVEFLKESNELLKTFRIKYKIFGDLKENNLLSELQYSLLRVYNYKKPYKHFAFSYVYLDETDYNTIVEGRLFISRTAFGKLINSLPPLHIQNFILTLINSQGIHFFNNRDYIGALKDLKTYIVEEIENRGKFLISTETILRENFSQLLDVNEIGFCDSEDKRPDIIIKQASLFRTLFGISKEFNIWDMIEEGISENINEEFFNKSFAKKDWPINYENY